MGTRNGGVGWWVCVKAVGVYVLELVVRDCDVFIDVAIVQRYEPPVRECIVAAQDAVATLVGGTIREVVRRFFPEKVGLLFRRLESFTQVCDLYSVSGLHVDVFGAKHPRWLSDVRAARVDQFDKMRLCCFREVPTVYSW